MARGGLGPTVILAVSTAVLLLLATPGLAPALAPTPATNDEINPAGPVGPAFDDAWARQAEQGLAWSSVERDELVAPLVGGAALAGWTATTIAHYREGQAWASRQLDQGDRATLATGLVDLLSHQDVRRQALAVEAVPDALVAPLATLVSAQQHAAGLAQSAPSPDAGPWTSARQGTHATAWLLGVLDRTAPALEAAAADDAPTDPLPLDPLGLVILGGSGDDTYEPHGLGPLTWQGPYLVVEPGGDDTYNVPVAAPMILETPPDPVFGEDRWDVFSGVLAVDLSGDDDYNDRVAASENNEAPHVLLDRRGNDTYGDLAIEGSIASSEHGSAALLDRSGNDTYLAFDRSIAYARAEEEMDTYALGVLGDWEGDDTFLASQDQPDRDSDGRTHASADNAGAIALLRDYKGDDVHSADIFTHANSDDGGISQYIDDRGADSLFVDLIGGSLGWRAGSEEGSSSPGDRGLAYYLDGSGEDKFDWREMGDPLPFGNNLTRVNATPTYRYSVFVDCPGPSDGPVPCRANQSTVLSRIAENETPTATPIPS